MKQYLSLFTVLFILLTFIPITQTLAQTNNQVEALIDLGIKYEREDKLDDAIETFKKVIKIDPTNILVKVRLAKILSWKNRYDEALTILNDVLKTHPNHPEALFRKAQILSWQGKYKEALAIYQIYLLEEKNDADALMGIARVSFWSGQYEKSIEYLHRALEAGADEIDIRTTLAKVYLAMSRKKEAMDELKKVLDLDPKNAEAKRLLKGIHTIKTFEITPANLRWDIYTDGSIGVAITSSITYHHKQDVDITLQYENAVNNSIHDYTFSLDTMYRKIPNLYLGGNFGFTINPDFSPLFSLQLNTHYAFKDLFTPGVIFSMEKYNDDTLFLIQPELQRDFSDLSYILIRYKQYFFKSGYRASQVGLWLNFEYSRGNPIFVSASYGGDTEIKDKNRRIFNFGFGISYHFTDNIESSISYSWLETLYGKTHEIEWQNTVKW